MSEATPAVLFHICMRKGCSKQAEWVYYIKGMVRATCQKHTPKHKLEDPSC